MTLERVLSKDYYLFGYALLVDTLDNEEINAQIIVTESYESTVRYRKELIIKLGLPCLDSIYTSGHIEPTQTLLYYLPVGAFKCGLLGIALHIFHLVAHARELTLYRSLGLSQGPKHLGIFTIELYNLLERHESWQSQLS